MRQARSEDACVVARIGYALSYHQTVVRYLADWFLVVPAINYGRAYGYSYLQFIADFAHCAVWPREVVPPLAYFGTIRCCMLQCSSICSKRLALDGKRCMQRHRASSPCYAASGSRGCISHGFDCNMRYVVRLGHPITPTLTADGTVFLMGRVNLFDKGSTLVHNFNVIAP